MSKSTNRREFLTVSATAGLVGLAPNLARAQSQIPKRAIPNTGELLPVVGLGSSKPVSQIATRGTGPIADVLRMLVAHGGSFVDTWPRDAENDRAFGEVISEPDLRDKLFLTTKVDQVGEQAGIDQFEQALEHYQRSTIDLAQIFSLTDLDTHWPNLKSWKDTGRARYIGVTVSNAANYEQLERFVERENPDFAQVNFSITERESEDRLIPLLADRGIAVVINRPFMNGSYFERLENISLPEWAAEFDCHTWAEFSLKYIIANTNLTCVLTETSNPVHMQENALAATTRLPNASHRRQMREFIDAV